MKNGKFSEHRIVLAIKKQEAGIAVKEIARNMGISEAILYNWEVSYGGMEAIDAPKMKDLERENIELKDVCRDEHLESIHEQCYRKNF